MRKLIVAFRNFSNSPKKNLNFFTTVVFVCSPVSLRWPPSCLWQCADTERCVGGGSNAVNTDVSSRRPAAVVSTAKY